MNNSHYPIEIYLESGRKLVIAGSVEWPGLCRSGRDEESAKIALFNYSSRYGIVPKIAGFEFVHPTDSAAFVVVERLPGNSSTDYGVPYSSPSRDNAPVNVAELKKLQKILTACWQVFDEIVKKANGKMLRKGPRGGGRDLEKIVAHVTDANNVGYLSALGGKLDLTMGLPPLEQEKLNRQTILEILAASARGEIPARGPRGGKRWTPWYFVRRAAWHILDHAWEIEDRMVGG